MNPKSKSKESKRKYNNNEVVQKLSQRKIQELSKLVPVELFLEIYTNQDRFIATLEQESSDRILCSCFEFLVQIIELPTKALLKSLFQRVLTLESFFKEFLLGQVKADLKKNSSEFSTHVLSFCEFVSKYLPDQKIFSEFLDEIMLAFFKFDVKGCCTEYRLKFDGIRAEIQTKSKPESILPTLDDFNGSKSQYDRMKPNVIRGKFDSVETYLDTHKLFLREDFIGPLIKNINMKLTSDQNLVQIRKSEKGSFIAINFLPQKFIFGNLIVLTSSIELPNLILGTVVDVREDEGLEFEIITIENEIDGILQGKFLLFESELFFDPFFQVFKCLSQYSLDRLPLKEIILDLNKEDQQKKIKPMNVSAISLDPSQYEALKSGLEQKMTLIQGPPGTGKTFIGLKLIEMMIKLNPKDKILIVCVTNHVLDELLKGISKFTQRIVRFGNQSKNEELDCFNARELAKESDKYIRDMYSRVKSLTKDSEQENVTEFVKKRVQHLEEIQEVKQLEYFRKIKSKSIVGMTSTSAARMKTLLELYQPRVVVFEEAAEILECHTLAALTKSLKQIILIGDHHQLRPTVNVFQLTERFNMDVSLFERLINNDLAFISLEKQSRMRPEISEIIRGTFYDKYDDNNNVLKLPDFVKGMDKNMFFFDHKESEGKDGYSRFNLFESKLSIHLCNYIIKQGYKPEEVTILTTYNGQTERIQQDLRTDFPDLSQVKVKTVDNFQGEESNIVILNLVRSNNENAIGYLTLKNRICVALSRARFGFYMIGNMEVLSKKSPIWSEISQKLINKASIGDSINLKCPSHGDIIRIKAPEDFETHCNTLGGCKSKDCAITCPHCQTTCTLPCHPSNLSHICICK